MRSATRALIPLVCAYALALSACDKSEPNQAPKQADKQAAAKAKSPEPPPQPDTPPAPALIIATAKITPVDQPDKSITLTADGQVSLDGERIGSLSADGKLTAADGKVMLEIGSDGQVVTSDGKPAPFTLTSTGAVMTGPNGDALEVTFATSGEVVMATKNADGSPAEPDPSQPKPPKLTAEGCAGPVAKTCALTLMAYMLIPQEVVVEGPVEVPAAP